MKKQKNKRRNNVLTTDFDRWQRKDTTHLAAIPSRSVLRPLNKRQGQYKKAISHSQITFGIGPAGTGKTYVAVAMAINALMERSVERIIITRPAVETGESLGFLPGKLNEKYEPYLAPMRKVFHTRMGQSHYEGMLKTGRIVAYPLAYMRGESFDDSFIIVDEAQNMTSAQIKMVLTRIGKNSKMVINGDPAQTDLQSGSGLTDAIGRLSQITGINVVRFSMDDIVRNDIISDILAAYRTDPELESY